MGFFIIVDVDRVTLGIPKMCVDDKNPVVGVCYQVVEEYDTCGLRHLLSSGVGPSSFGSR
jgi:hypothetical protein